MHAGNKLEALHLAANEMSCHLDYFVENYFMIPKTIRKNISNGIVLKQSLEFSSRVNRNVFYVGGY